VIICVRFVGSLRASTKRSRLNLEFEETVKLKEVVERIIQEQPRLKQALIDPELGDPRTNALVLVNGKEISVLEGLDTKVTDGDEVIFVPVVHGG
jgi:molybdopterin synthase sulfur carrier subunit